jgi:para-aminobenzoate synthetase/4-amino-4-deoxychorismate lyase
LASWTQLPAHLHFIIARSAHSVLLQTARFDSVNKTSMLFHEPLRIIAAQKLDEIPEMFCQIEQALSEGHHVAGYLSYECGYHFERFDHATLADQAYPLAWFGVYHDPILYHHDTAELQRAPAPVAVLSAPPPAPLAERVDLDITPHDYHATIERIQQYIHAGDTYQVNFTNSVSFPVAVDPDIAFATLLKQQPVSYSAFLNIAGQYALSLSPELFFQIDGGRITTRPMKGTMSRGLDSTEDAAAALRLHRDEKNRAEHLMIVDLLRNDLGRICAMGSVQVDDLFSIERYATLLQMTSTISGTLRPGLSYYEIFKALFPSGSITGAPKIRTMQIIRELERDSRGIYTGAIGFFSPDGSASFNVAIRTLVLNNKQAHMGVGGGIVADSNAEEEYRECKLKTEFLVRSRPDFQLIETMRWEREFHLLPLHLERLQDSASYFDRPFDREAILTALAKASQNFLSNQLYRVRLLLDPAGAVSITSATFRPEQAAGRIRISSERTSSTDVFLRHKTTHRSLYDAQYASARADGFDDVIFLNERSELAEGSISNLFIERHGALYTPPLSSGVLPGIFRRHLLETNPNAQEKILTLPDLHSADAIFLCNSLRGLRKVKLS